MKTTGLSARTRKILIGSITVMLMLMLPISLQAKKFVFLPSSVAPAAEGYVLVNTDRNHNNIIKIHIRYLAKIERLDPAMKTYVVWMVTDRETTVNIGRISSSNSLNVTFETVSSFKPTKIFITAEENESSKVPGEKIVLSTNNFWEK